MRPRMRSSARRGVMSCPSSCARRRGGASSSARPAGSCTARGRARPSRPARAETGGGARSVPLELDAERDRGARAPGAGRRGCGRASVSSSSIAGMIRIRSRARARSGCCWRPSGWRPSFRSSARGNEAYEAYREQGRMRDGRRFGRPPESASAAGGARGQGERDRPGLAADPGRVRVRAGIQRPDRGQRAADRAGGRDHQPVDRLLAAVADGRRRPPASSVGRASISELLEAVAADAGYWNEQQMDEVVADRHIPVLVAPDKGSRDTPKRWLNERPRQLDANGARAQTTVASDTRNENRRSSRSTVTPNTTRGSSASTDEAGSRCAPSSGY